MSLSGPSFREVWIPCQWKNRRSFSGSWTRFSESPEANNNQEVLPKRKKHGSSILGLGDCFPSEYGQFWGSMSILRGVLHLKMLNIEESKGAVWSFVWLMHQRKSVLSTSAGEHWPSWFAQAEQWSPSVEFGWLICWLSPTKSEWNSIWL